jgi:hypothetical protein
MKNVPIVLQGPTTYCKEVAEHYKNYFCVWSTWNSEPQENLDFLSKLDNVKLITDNLPTYSDEENVGLTNHESWTRQRSRYQFTSTLNGFKFLKNNQFTYGIKIRSDLLLDIPTLLTITDKKSFNSLGWHTGSVGYLVDYYFSAEVDLIISLMEKCLDIMHPCHSENLMTYVLLEELKFRNINHTMSDELYIYSLKHNYTTQLLMNEVKNNKWLVKNDINQFSSNMSYQYTVDHFPDNYQLTYGWGPGV